MWLGCVMGCKSVVPKSTGCSSEGVCLQGAVLWCFVALSFTDWTGKPKTGIYGGTVVNTLHEV